MRSVTGRQKGWLFMSSLDDILLRLPYLFVCIIIHWTISFLNGRNPQRTVNFRNQRLWSHLWRVGATSWHSSRCDSPPYCCARLASKLFFNSVRYSGGSGVGLGIFNSKMEQYNDGEVNFGTSIDLILEDPGALSWGGRKWIGGKEMKRVPPYL